MRLNGAASARNICCFIVLCAAVCSRALRRGQSIDGTYKQALKEGGALNVYGTLTPDTAVKALRYSRNAFRH